MELQTPQTNGHDKQPRVSTKTDKATEKMPDDYRDQCSKLAKDWKAGVIKHSELQFAWGEWYNNGEKWDRGRKKLFEKQKLEDLAYSSVQVYGSVTRDTASVRETLKRFKELTYSHYAKVQKFKADPKQQEKWLLEAADKHWSSKKLGENINNTEKDPSLQPDQKAQQDYKSLLQQAESVANGKKGRWPDIQHLTVEQLTKLKDKAELAVKTCQEVLKFAVDALQEKNNAAANS